MTSASGWRDGLLITTLAALLFFWNLGSLPFYSQGEPREALEVWEIYHNGEWIMPLRNGIELPSKPPLFHWIGALIASVTGSVDESSARMPSALCAMLTVLAVWAHGRRRFGAAAGLFAAVILMTNLEFLRAARVARVDMVLTLCLTGAFVTLDKALAARKPAAFTLAWFYLFTGAAALAKGPVGIALPAVAAFSHLVITGRLRQAGSFHPILGGLVVVLIAGSWYALAVMQAGDAFVQKQLLFENLQRFVGVEDGGVNQSHPFYYYLPGLLKGLAPWSVLLLPLGLHLYRRRGRWQADGTLFPLIWIAVVFAVYSVAAGKRTVYILSLYPAVALLLGKWMSEVGATRGEITATERRASYVLAGVVAGLIGVLTITLVAEAGGVSVLEAIRPYLHRRDQANIPLVRELIRGELGILTAWIAALIASAALLLFGARQSRRNALFIGFAVIVVSTTLIVNGAFLPRFVAERSLAPFAARARSTVGKSPVGFYRTFDYGTVFYFQRHIPVVPPEEFPRSDTPPFLFIWETDWTALPEATRSLLEVVDTSEGTGPEGGSRLLLLRSKDPSPCPFHDEVVVNTFPH